MLDALSQPRFNIGGVFFLSSVGLCVFPQYYDRVEGVAPFFLLTEIRKLLLALVDRDSMYNT